MDVNELVKKAKAQDENAFNELIEIYKSTIKQLTRKYFIIGADCEDVYQEALIGFLKAVKGYDEGHNASFKTFAIMCMKAQIITKINNSQNAKNKALNDAVEMEDDAEDLDGWAYALVCEELSPEDKLINRQKMKVVINYIKNEFNDTQRRVLSAYLYNYTYAQIAEMIGRDAKFVDNCLTQMRKKLATIIKREDL